MRPVAALLAAFALIAQGCAGTSFMRGSPPPSEPVATVVVPDARDEIEVYRRAEAERIESERAAGEPVAGPGNSHAVKSNW